MSRRSPTGSRRAFTLLELLVVLVLLGLSSAAVLPVFRLPAAPPAESPLVRARALAVRRGESLRLEILPDGRWQVASAADTTDATLLHGRIADDTSRGARRSFVISPLGTCLPDGPSLPGTPAWEPVRCGVTRH